MDVSVDLYDGDITRIKQVFAGSIQAQREDGRVFSEPHFVPGRGIPFIREALHCAPQWLVLLRPQVANRDRLRDLFRCRAHSAIRTSACAVASR